MAQTLSKEIVLIGGGHAHAIALRQFALNPLPGVRLTLIVDTLHTPYSGMLPGHIAGFYSFDQTHIDLHHLCQFARAQLYQDRAIGLDLKRNQVLCAHRPPVRFDLLSIDIGSTPNQIQVPGANHYAIPAKPVSQFLNHWRETIESFARHPTHPLKLAIVGGGAGGVELALTMQQGLFVCRQATGGMRNIDASFVMYTASFPEIHLFHQGQEIMSSHNRVVRKRIAQLMGRRDIQLHLGERVTQVSEQGLQCQSGFTLECDRVFWVTQASAPPWLKAAGLATDTDGFILVKDSLQSISHPQVFAAGDIATMVNYTRPKAGVFAVRQGQPLYENLKQAVLGKAPKPYRPQKQILGLIGTGDGKAIASWGKWGLGPNPLLWRWKDWIDRRFMAQFEDFGRSPTHPSLAPIPIPPERLSSVLKRVITDNPKLESLIEIENPGDNLALSSVTPGLLIKSMDLLTDSLRDPYLFGILATHHCLNPILAKGANPHSVLGWIELPNSLPTQQEETLYQLLSGVLQALTISQTQLVGCRASLGPCLSLGFSTQGYVDPEPVLYPPKLQPGQVLILTKPLGVGALMTAQEQYKSKGRWLEGAIASMIQSNYPASLTFLETGATACTAVGNLGLLSHLTTLINHTSVSISLNLDTLPVLEGTLESLRHVRSSPLHQENTSSTSTTLSEPISYLQNASSFDSHPVYPLLFDPQWSGGLVAGIPHPQAEECLKLLQNLGYTQSAIIGEVHLPAGDLPPIELTVNEE
ncbi:MULTISPECIES: selenide, water dikinase SelD [unclassified Roseofilum]|uniref:selenide, water dikinase SelD n=1 Tax=unclassified Roseofilum TaxID=2620099 RepID=UPI000E960C41|nr:MULTISPECIES: selenide, water dikinase SelD [unclassified Roseofilum]MBP0011148.1 selenide, water dikinase SelD [Roseofilum sp. Belize Diploria]MBP0033772.1 selenide, water dikinase SelD [Roseofilum sp. Belize BBD 4]HBR00150.1 selenide, water dikinase SelD [Cyanobacteria bacterium UBA11691]